jgi:hypothetical protein
MQYIIMEEGTNQLIILSVKCETTVTRTLVVPEKEEQKNKLIKKLSDL